MNIKIESLTKKYRKNMVLDKININIEPHIYGLMGPNGSGKTTLIRCLLQLIPYQEGTITYEQENKDIEFTKINFGYLPQVFELFQDLTVYEQLEYFLMFKNVDRKDFDDEIHRVLKMVNLSRSENMKCGQLSGGMVRRVGIAQALLGKPDVLIFDEPTLGLDPDERLNLKRIIKSLDLNIPIILSTHIIEDVYSVCTHGIFIKDGNIEYSGELERAISELEGKVYSCLEEDCHISEDVLIRSIDDEYVRIISDMPLDYTFLKREKPDINDLYQYINHRK